MYLTISQQVMGPALLSCVAMRMAYVDITKLVVHQLDYINYHAWSRQTIGALQTRGWLQFILPVMEATKSAKANKYPRSERPGAKAAAQTSVFAKKDIEWELTKELRGLEHTEKAS